MLSKKRISSLSSRIGHSGCDHDAFTEYTPCGHKAELYQEDVWMRELAHVLDLGVLLLAQLPESTLWPKIAHKRVRIGTQVMFGKDLATFLCQHPSQGLPTSSTPETRRSCKSRGEAHRQDTLDETRERGSSSDPGREQTCTDFPSRKDASTFPCDP